METWNPIAGCTKVSAGCAHCYAETMAKRLKAMAQKDIATGKNPGRKGMYLDVIGANGKWNGKISFDEAALSIPLKRRKPTTWFVNSMSDLFHEAVPFEFVDRVFAVMALTPQHTYQILTKRPERMAEYFDRFMEAEFDGTVGDPPTPRYSGAYMESRLYRVMNEVGEAAWQANLSNARTHQLLDGCSRIFPLPNVWLGTSVENQKCADERIPHLLKCPAAVRFLSVEPMLEEINLHRWFCRHASDGYPEQKLSGWCTPSGEVHWVIVGGESGGGSRPFNLEWARSIVSQCKAAGVAVFVKQLGARPVAGERIGTRDGTPLREALVRDFKNSDDRKRVDAMKDAKGGNPAEWPADLRVRQMPEVTRG